MEVLSTESVEKLRAACKEEPSLISRDFGDLDEDFNLLLVPFNAELNFDFDLILPSGFTQETNKDLENCKLLWEEFSSLTAAQATDERLWTTLCFKNFSNYALSRWPIERAKTPINHVQDHWFARTSRNRMRDNSISRLWWMAYIANRVENSSIDEVLRTLFFNSDYRSNLLERNSSANASNVVVSILSISQSAFDSGVEFDRDKFRSFMKKVDFVGKRTSLPSLSADDLNSVLSPIYAEAYEMTKKKSGFLSRFIK